MCCHTHSSTGYSPVHLLFSKDPILPFELANKKVSTTSGDWSGNDSENNSEFNDPGEDPDDPVDNNNDSTKGVSMNEVDEVFQMVERIEKEQKNIFATAGKRIIKAQKQQAKGLQQKAWGGYKF